MDLCVIIVDDDRDYLDIMGRRIRELGYTDIQMIGDPFKAGI